MGCRRVGFAEESVNGIGKLATGKFDGTRYRCGEPDMISETGTPRRPGLPTVSCCIRHDIVVIHAIARRSPHWPRPKSRIPTDAPPPGR
jgi:hypothetical protein